VRRKNILGKIIIKCAKCKQVNWVKVSPEERTRGMPEHHDLKCGNCGAIYCAKNREYDCEEGEI
jgi:hypothetical protein